MRLEASASGLADRVPLVSARSLFTPGQRNGVIGLLIAVVIGLVLNAILTIALIIAVFTLGYLIVVVYRFYLFTRSSKTDALEIVTDEEALIISDSELPFYTVMIPAYNEASVIVKLVENVAKLDYPTDRLEVLILVEEDDVATLSALSTANAPSQFRLVLIPPAEPRTKPKALNFGLTLARGDIVAVYDVEDAPDILQLRRAAVALGRYGPEVGCVQAQLSYNNATQNIITKWFTIEYAMWFSFFLPGLSSLGAPIPLGGTSNHFRRSALRALGAWDAYNVTEDCDLGIRMFREHYQIKVLESETLEEANSDFVNWVKQRSRWYKGYLQTFLIHLRSPRQLVREVGEKGASSLVRLRWRHPDPRRVEPSLLASDHPLVRRSASIRESDLPGSLVLRESGSLGLRQLPDVVPDRADGAPHQTGRSDAGSVARARVLGDDVGRRPEGDVATSDHPILLGKDDPWARARCRRRPLHREARTPPSRFVVHPGGRQTSLTSLA